MNTVNASRTPSNGTKTTWNSKATPQEDEALGAFHEAALGVVAEGLRLRPLVGDDRADAEDRKRQQSQPWLAARGEVPRHATEDEGVGHPVGNRVEEGAFLGGRAGRLGDSAVQGVHETADCEQHDADPEPA